jgi:hypothetical protein
MPKRGTIFPYFGWLLPELLGNSRDGIGDINQ